ncbi:SDR family oxidoreductase [Nocardia jiangxiensis]|uniref:SDR family oxidoreductase n=1 Tax=Nocardia jiangxiensis TaxID=282685 RepID=A0ABW6RZA5_9NOCA
MEPGPTGEDVDVVALVGAGGHTGREVTFALSQRPGTEVRAIVRSTAAAERALASGATTAVLADLTDPVSLLTAFSGAAVVHVIPPAFNANEERLIGNAANAAVAAGARLFGYHSVLQPDDPHLPHHLRKNRAEIRIRETDVPWVVIRPCMYAQTAVRLLGGGGAPRLPFGPGGRFSPIDLSDIAEATATALSGNGYAYGVFELAGPQLLTIQEMSAVITGTSSLGAIPFS